MRGIGNGIAVILATGIITQLSVGRTVRPEGFPLSSGRLAALLVVVIAVTGLIAFIERAQRRLRIECSGRQVGSLEVEPRSSYMSLKLNSAGIIPAVVASWVLLVAVTLGNLFTREGASGPPTIVGMLDPQHPISLIVSAILIVVSAFFYTAFLLDPDETAENLQRSGGSIPMMEPGETMAEHIDHVLSRITILGAAYLALVCLIPEILAYIGLSFYVRGTSLLILVCTVLDLDAQARALRTG